MRKIQGQLRAYDVNSRAHVKAQKVAFGIPSRRCGSFRGVHRSAQACTCQRFLLPRPLARRHFQTITCGRKLSYESSNFAEVLHRSLRIWQQRTCQFLLRIDAQGRAIFQIVEESLLRCAVQSDDSFSSMSETSEHQVIVEYLSLRLGVNRSLRSQAFVVHP